jgi:hypothetical protein
MESGFVGDHLQGSRTKVAELSIASKMCIHVPDEKHLGFKNLGFNEIKLNLVQLVSAPKQTFWNVFVVVIATH